MLVSRLAQANIDPTDVTDVVITHFHADHIGGLDKLPNARVHTGPGNWPGHVGAFTCQLPEGFSPNILEYEDGGPLGARFPLAMNGAVSAVPLPGHTPGHVGVLVEFGDERLLIAGDATFDERQTMHTEISGVSEQPELARETQEKMADLLRDGVLLLPAHDSTVFERLSRPGGMLETH